MSDAELQLIAGPLRVPLISSPEGPALDVDREPWLRPLAWALDGLTQPDAAALRASVAAGEPVYMGPIEVRPLQPNDDLEAGRAEWQELTGGAELSEPLTVVSVDVDTAILPRKVFVDVVEQLTRRRETEAVAPPWLFRPDPAAEEPHPSERDAVLALEERTPTEAELTQVGLRDRNAWEPKLRALLDWGAVKLARAYVDHVRSHDPGQPPSPPWLFCLGPRWDLAHPSERNLVAELDREAEAIEIVERSLEGSEEPPELIAHRAKFLRNCQAAGLLSADQQAAKLRRLEEWGARSLAELYRAALEGLRYLSSPERARFNPDATHTDLLGAPVCLDIFRGLKTPPNVSTFSWISWGEHLLREHGPGVDVQADQGEFPYQDQDGLVMVLWRKDAGVPALRYVALQPAVIDTSLIREWLA